jgi:hypothetical protein
METWLSLHVVRVRLKLAGTLVRERRFVCTCALVTVCEDFCVTL